MTWCAEKANAPYGDSKGGSPWLVSPKPTNPVLLVPALFRFVNNYASNTDLTSELNQGRLSLGRMRCRLFPLTCEREAHRDAGNEILPGYCFSPEQKDEVVS
jgi:hypothetical protein